MFASALVGDDPDVRFAQSAPQRRVLIVEDDCLIASLLTDEVGEMGYSVVGPAGNLGEATAIASTLALDGALLDIELRLDSALSVAQILFDRHVPFAFMTAGVESAGGRFDDVPVLEKPFTVAELRRALQHLMPA